MHERFVDRLTPVLAEGDLVAAWELFDSLEGDELREARDWFARSKRWCAEPGLTYAGADYDETFETRIRSEWIVSMCTVRLMGPKTAAGSAGLERPLGLHDEPGGGRLRPDAVGCRSGLGRRVRRGCQSGQPRQPRTQHQREPLSGVAVRCRPPRSALSDRSHLPRLLVGRYR